MRESTIILCRQHKVENPVKNWYEQLFEVKKPKEEKKKMIVDITITVPIKKAPKRKVRVFSNFVKVGWDQYSIKHDYYTGYEYVIIKGNRYEVVRDVFGQGVLVEI